MPKHLFEASAVGDTDTVKTYIHKDPQLIDTYSHDGWTRLHLAAHFGHDESVKFLIDRGADIHVKNGDGQTAKDIAKAKNHKETAALLG